MPNTLVHLGVQAVGSRLAIPDCDLKWVLLGCVIPDVPWILQRLVRKTDIDIGVYDLRLYALVQASLIFCLVLCVFFAVLSEHPKRVFVVLAFNSIVHLLLDSTEIKWGHGVNLLAPFSWQQFSLDLIWPDSTTVLVLTVVGLVLILRYAFKAQTTIIAVQLMNGKNLLAALLVLGLYLMAPIAFLDGPYSLDTNSIATLKESDNRVGRMLYLDRGGYVKGDKEDFILTIAADPVRVAGGLRAESDAVVSLIAEFVENDAVEIHALHVYEHYWRDFASYTGLLFVALYWITRLFREHRNPTTTQL